MGIFSNKIVGIFKERERIDSLLNQLENLGYHKNDISVLAKDHDVIRNNEYINLYRTNKDGTITDMEEEFNNERTTKNYEDTHEVVEKDPSAMLKGASTGATIGLLAGLSLLLVPGIGPILASGFLLSALTAATGGAAIGATAGTLIGLLKDEGIPQDRADIYNHHFNHGDVLVIVGADENKQGKLRSIFNDYNALSIDTF
ncbi:MAG: hypothetical protein AABZ74_03030 [Cyanobacteriota bacterium]